MSRRRLFSALLLWGGLPLAVGIGAYLWPVAGEADGLGARKPSALSQRSAMGQRTDVAAAIAEAHATSDATWAAELARRFPALPDAGSLDTAALRELLTKLQGECPKPNSIEGDDLEISRYLWEQQKPLLKELIAREGGAAADWIDDHLPALGYSAMYFLAERDPDAALDHLVHVQRNFACGEETLFGILSASAANRGGQGLLTAAQQIPWHLCQSGYLDGSYRLPDSTTPDEMRLWATNGAALYLAQQGVELRGVFRLLAKTDPELAVSTWLEWSEAVPSKSGRAFEELIRSAEVDRSNGHWEAFEKSDDATRARLVAAFDRLTESPDYDYLRGWPIDRALHGLPPDQAASRDPAQKEEDSPSAGEEPGNVPPGDK